LKLKGFGSKLQSLNYYRNDFFNIYLRWFIIEMIVEGERIEVSIDGKKIPKIIFHSINKT